MRSQKRRPRGSCYLCGKLVWTRGVRDANGLRHADCVPTGGARRYRVDHERKG